MTYDLLLKGGTLIDAAQGIHATKDIAFKDGLVAEIGDDLTREQAAEVIECSDHIVSPGMIDLHVHVFWGCSHYGIEPDPHCIAKGVTTALDVGSAGADTFPGFRKYVVEASSTRLLTFLNISSQGMLTADIGELENIRHADVSRAVEMVEQHRDIILGIKVRLTKTLVNESAGIKPLYLAREAADAVGLPIMVHSQNAWSESIDDILGVMGKGDILTHCFHGSERGIFDDNGRLRDSVREASDRGVLFDVGHGRGSFSWDVAERAIQQGFLPNTISSDLHIYNVNGPVFDLATTASKFLYLGLSLEDVMAKVTALPAQVLGMSDKIGSLSVGAVGDTVILRLETGSFDFMDVHGQHREGSKRLVPITVIRAGSVYKEAG